MKSMPALAGKRRTRKAISASRVKQILTELAYRLHATRVVGKKAESAAR
jgi:hypothetical protein